MWQIKPGPRLYFSCPSCSAISEGRRTETCGSGKSWWEPDGIPALCVLFAFRRFFPIIKWIFTSCTKNLLLFIINCETKVKDNFIYVSFVSPRSAELGDQNLFKCPVLVPVAWESGRNGQQGSVPATGPAMKVLDTLYCSCSSTALAVQASCPCRDRLYVCVCCAREGKLIIASEEWESAWLDPWFAGPGTT